MMIHDFDLARFILGEDPVAVHAAGSVMVEPQLKALGDVDTAMVTMQTPSGALVHINNSRRAVYGYDQRVEAYGSKGMAATANERLDAVEVWNEAGASASPIRPNFLSRYMPSYAREVDHFADVVAGRAKSQVGYAEGLAALAWAEACAESARTNTVVKL